MAWLGVYLVGAAVIAAALPRLPYTDRWEPYEVVSCAALWPVVFVACVAVLVIDRGEDEP